MLCLKYDNSKEEAPTRSQPACSLNRGRRHERREIRAGINRREEPRSCCARATRWAQGREGKGRETLCEEAEGDCEEGCWGTLGKESRLTPSSAIADVLAFQGDISTVSAFEFAIDNAYNYSSYSRLSQLTLMLTFPTNHPTP